MFKNKAYILLAIILMIYPNTVYSQTYELNWPLSNSQTRDVMTSTFGIRYNSSTTKDYDFHKGFDLSARNLSIKMGHIS